MHLFNLLVSLKKVTANSDSVLSKLTRQESITFSVSEDLNSSMHPCWEITVQAEAHAWPEQQWYALFASCGASIRVAFFPNHVSKTPFYCSGHFPVTSCHPL